jgi:flavin-binding protein dodecin
VQVITKTVRLAGSSDNSIEEAISGVVGRAAETINDIVGYRVVEIGGEVDASGLPSSFHVDLEITFVVKESSTHD